jgi:hypothetical protein
MVCGIMVQGENNYTPGEFSIVTTNLYKLRKYVYMGTIWYNHTLQIK